MVLYTVVDIPRAIEFGIPLELHRSNAGTHQMHRPALQLYAMPLLNVIAEDLIDEPVLLDDGQACEFTGNDFEGVHRAAATANVLDLVAVLAAGITGGKEHLC
jgi:hypothetical protein